MALLMLITVTMFSPFLTVSYGFHLVVGFHAHFSQRRQGVVALVLSHLQIRI